MLDNFIHSSIQGRLTQEESQPNKKITACLRVGKCSSLLWFSLFIPWNRGFLSCSISFSCLCAASWLTLCWLALGTFTPSLTWNWPWAALFKPRSEVASAELGIGEVQRIDGVVPCKPSVLTAALVYLRSAMLVVPKHHRSYLVLHWGLNTQKKFHF